MQTISVHIIDDEKNSKDSLETLLKPCAEHVHVLRSFPNFHDAMKVIPTCSPDVIVLDVKEIEQGVRETAFLVSRFPNTVVAVTAADKSPDSILRLIRAGAREYLTKPLNAADTVEAFQRLSKLHLRKNCGIAKKGSVISVYNPSGGMGTTTMAVNLAATLATRESKVALVDLNLLNGDVSTFLDLTPRYTLTDVTAKTGQIDTTLVKSVLVRHSSGIQVLNGPADLGDGDRVTPEQLQEVIALLQKMFKYIIIDTGGQLSGCNLAAFEYSEYVLFNTVLNVPAIRNAKRYISAMGHEGIGTDRVKLVVNRHIPKEEMKVADAENALGMGAFQVVPNAYFEARTAINRGMPLITCYPRSPVAKAIEDLAKNFVLDEQPYRQDMPEESPSWHPSLTVFGNSLGTARVATAVPGSAGSKAQPA